MTWGLHGNWFQYVRRVYATTINFPCISTLIEGNFDQRMNNKMKIWKGIVFIRSSIKVSTVDIESKESGFRIFHTKVPSSGKGGAYLITV